MEPPLSDPFLDVRDRYRLVLCRCDILFGDPTWYAKYPALRITGAGCTPDEAVADAWQWLAERLDSMAWDGETLPSPDADLNEPEVFNEMWQRFLEDHDLPDDEPVFIDHADERELELYGYEPPLKVDPNGWRPLYARLPAMGIHDLAGSLLAVATGLDHAELEEVLIHGRPVPDDTSARGTLRFFVTLLRTTSEGVAPLLGVTTSRVRRNDRLTPDMLDRVQAVLDIYVETTKLCGYEQAPYWLRRSNPALGDHAPLALMTTAYGRARVEALLASLLLADRRGDEPRLEIDA